jgi:preprotein translocase subunit Sss1
MGRPLRVTSRQDTSGTAVAVATAFAIIGLIGFLAFLPA